MKNIFVRVAIYIATSLLTAVSANAQVTIGANLPPTKGALLELKTQQADATTNATSDKGGLVLPRVALVDPATLEPFVAKTDLDWTDTTAKAALIKSLIGLLVYNVGTTNGLTEGVLIWTGSVWDKVSTAHPWVNPVTTTAEKTVHATHEDAAIATSAAVTIGSIATPSAFALLDLKETTAGTSSKAIHLPRLDKTKRDALTATEKNLTKGLAIYNTDTKCYEYWNASKWVSLCTGAANIVLTPDNLLPPDQNIPATGNTYGPIVPSETPEPNCGVDMPFTIMVVSGNNWLSVDILNSETGNFSYTADENRAAVQRVGIIRITNSCTNEYKEFMVTQDGDPSVCKTTATPEIAIAGTTSSVAGVLCAGGQTILTIKNPATVNLTDDNDYVWARNGMEVGRELTYYAVQSGRYEVYIGGVGCPVKSAAANITNQDSPAAPKAVLAIDASDAGVICGGTPITLTAYAHPTHTPAQDNIYWYKNGNLDSGPNASKSGISVVGDTWTAVVINNTTGCVSKSSNTIITREGTGTKPNLTASGILINGQPMSGNPTLCPGSTLKLEIGAPNDTYSYEWSANKESIGSGSLLYYIVPKDVTQLVLEVVVSGTGCVTSVALDSQLNTTQPAKPAINSSTEYVCSSSTLTLSTSSVNGVTYQWFRNGSPIVGQTSSTLTVNNAGAYEVQASIGACQSEKSDIRNITLAGAPTSVVFTVAPTKAIPNSEIIFQASGVNVTSWEWSTNGLQSTDGNSATYKWSAEGNNTITATAKNACGTTQVSSSIEVKNLQMAQPVVVAVAAANCGSGAEYKVDLNSYDDADILTGLDWTIKNGTTAIPFTTIGSKNENVMFNYTGSGTYHIQATARGVGKSTSVISADVTIAVSSTTPLAAKLRGASIYDVAKSGSDLSQRLSNISAGSSYSYSLYRTSNNGSANVASNPLNFDTRPSGNYKWSVNDPEGLISNAATVNGNTAQTVSLQFSAAINNITSGSAKSLTLAVTVTDGGCHYPLVFPITVQDRFACGTGGYTTKLRSNTTGRQYDTYTFPTSNSDATPRCYTIEDSAEGSNSGACNVGDYARGTDNGRGYHYRSSNTNKSTACLSGWQIPTGGSANGGSDYGNLFYLFQVGTADYKTMWYKNWTVQHGYDCGTTNWYNFDIWNSRSTSSSNHEAWLNRSATGTSGSTSNSGALVPQGDATHQSFATRCVKDSY